MKQPAEADAPAQFPALEQAVQPEPELQEEAVQVRVLVQAQAV